MLILTPGACWNSARQSIGSDPRPEGGSVGDDALGREAARRGGAFGRLRLEQALLVEQRAQRGDGDHEALLGVVLGVDDAYDLAGLVERGRAGGAGLDGSGGRVHGAARGA